MKNLIKLISYKTAFYIVLVLLLISCAAGYCLVQKLEDRAIYINEPILFARTEFGSKTIDIEMPKGVYYPGSMIDQTDDIWQGEFQIKCYSGDYVYHSESLIINNSNQLIFSGAFELMTNDYNGDDYLDFLLGQKINDHYSIYELFSNDLYDGSFHKIECDDILSIAQTEPSIQLETGEQNSFYVDLYDPESGKSVRNLYWWKEAKFKLKESNIPY